MNTAVEWDRLLERNSDRDGSPCELCEWSQADLMQLITMAEAELTMRHQVQGSGMAPRGAHNPERSGSIPAPATTSSDQP